MNDAPSGFVGLIFGLVYLAVIGIMIASAWRVYTKAGRPGWAVIIPFYNTYIYLLIAGKPGWWLLLMFIPFVNVVVGILALISFCKAFGQSTGFILLMIFLPFIAFPMLAFGNAEYLGPQE